MSTVIRRNSLSDDNEDIHSEKTSETDNLYAYIFVFATFCQLLQRSGGYDAHKHYENVFNKTNLQYKYSINLTLGTHITL